MADVSELRFWPCCNDAIDWSHDGIIAVASEDAVQLIFPNTEYYDKVLETTTWQHTPLAVPWYTDEELPFKDPAPYPNYSVGEEISPNFAARIAWSAPGLAKHRRCALAVLTSGLNLSIWAAGGKLNEESSWKRLLIVNHTLCEYYDEEGPRSLEESFLTTDKFEKARLRARVRTFDWAPDFASTDSDGIMGTQLSWSPHIVAMSNDDNQIVFAVIKSPFTSFSHDDDWNVEVLGHFLVIPAPDQIFSEMPTSFEDIYQQQRFISHISWSPWTVSNGVHSSVLAYSTNTDVRARITTYKNGNLEFGSEVVLAEVDLRTNGAMKWSPRVFEDVKIFLILFSHTGITCLTVSTTDATVISQSSKNPDNRPDENAAIVWDHPPNAPAHVHFSTFTNTNKSLASAVRVSNDSTLTVLPAPSWREKINDNKALFSVQYELHGHVASKVWGLCASPLRDFIATFYTLHPSDMLEYGPPANRRSNITIHGLRSFSRPEINFPSGDVSAEAVTFTIKKWLDNTIEDSGKIPAFMDKVISKLLETHAPQRIAPDSAKELPAYNPKDLAQSVREFKLRAVLNPQSTKDRYTILTSLSCTSGPKPAPEYALIAFRLAYATSALPSSITHASPFSAEINASHHQVVALIETLLSSDADGNTDANGSSDTGAPNLDAPNTDTCDYCSAPIPFTDLDTAVCLNGHQFPRCGLSFLAVQAPRCTKKCGICATLYLCEEFVEAQEEGIGGQEGEKGANGGEVTRGQGETDGMDADGRVRSPAGEEGAGNGDACETSRGPKVTLAKLLFLACDVCIYCGGKYV